MTRDNKRMLKYLGIMFLSVVLASKLPHDSYSISQYIIPPIRITDGSSLYLSALIPLVLMVYGICGYLSLEKLANRSKVLWLIIILVVFIPFMNWLLEFGRTNYHWLRKDGLNAVDIKDPQFNFNGNKDELTFNVSLTLIDYSRATNEFKIRVYLPKYFNNAAENEYFDLNRSYRTHGYRTEFKVDETIQIKLNDSSVLQQMSNPQWNNDTIKYVLYNDKDAVEIIDHGW